MAEIVYDDKPPKREANVSFLKWKCPACLVWVREPISNKCVACKAERHV